jgi:hypothetical protein
VFETVALPQATPFTWIALPERLSVALSEAALRGTEIVFVVAL